MENPLKKIDKYSFSVKDTLGQGSFGKVYKGKNEKKNTVVAIKVIDKNMLKGDDYMLNGLFQEIKGKIEEKESTRVLINILTGFQDLLAHGIIHRDLKPDNILIQGDKYKLADFGFAKTVANFNNDLLTSLVGTPLYMSPQILKQELYTTKSDIWSLALIYYEMIFGQTPWQATSQYQLVNNIHTQSVKFPGAISDQAKDFILKCLVIDEEKRISWDEIYKHPLVASHFKDIDPKSIENREIFVVNDTRQQILALNVDLEDIFFSQQLTAGSMVDLAAFKKLINAIYKLSNADEYEILFKFFDKQKQGSFRFKAFQDWLVESNIRMSTKMPFKAGEKLQSVQVNEQNEKKALNTIELLVYAIDKYKVDTAKLYTKFDKSKQEQMAVNDFEQMVKRVDNSLSADDIQAAFQKFDSNKKGYISYQQFLDTINKFKENQL